MNFPSRIGASRSPARALYSLTALLVAATAFLTGTNARAHDTPALTSGSVLQDDGFSAVVGVGWQYAPTAYRSTRKTSNASLIAALRYKQLSLDLGGGLQYRFYDDGSLALHASVRYALEDGYSIRHIKNAPAGASGRNPAWWGGIGANWATPYVDLEGKIELSKRGTHLQAEVSKDLRYGAFVFSPFLKADWYDRKHTSYYYSTTQYKPLSAINLETGINMRWLTSEKTAILAGVSVRRLSNNVTRSELIERRYTPVVSAGVLYRF